MGTCSNIFGDIRENKGNYADSDGFSISDKDSLKAEDTLASPSEYHNELTPKKHKRSDAMAMINAYSELDEFTDDSNGDSVISDGNCGHASPQTTGVSDYSRRKVTKVINNRYELTKRQFMSAAWAYLNLNDEEEELKDTEYILESLFLLFGECNTKRSRFVFFDDQQEDCDHFSSPIKLDDNSNGTAFLLSKSSKQGVPTDASCVSCDENDSSTRVSSTFNDEHPLESASPREMVTGAPSSTTSGFQFPIYFDGTNTDDSYKYYSFSKDVLKSKCEHFFEQHGLCLKIRKLPVDYYSQKEADERFILKSTQNSVKYPSYHFISRQRRHMFEQLMRCRTFLDTRYNSCNEMRNSKSPFSLFELHSNIIKHFNELKDDLNDPEFSGIYISLTTKSFKTPTEFGSIKRSKVVAWVIIELLTSNERCLKCLWVHPSLCATSTTELLSALLPYSIYISFTVRPSILDERYPIKLFYTWLSDFDMFPRQALVLLTSFKRFGLIKHYDRLESSSSISGENDCEYFNGVTSPNLSHTDAGIRDEVCFCHAKANWEEIDQVIVACTEQLMYNLIPKWVRQVPSGRSPYLTQDLSCLTLPEKQFNVCKSQETHSEIKSAEFAGLEHSEIRVSSPLCISNTFVGSDDAPVRNKVEIQIENQDFKEPQC